MSILPLQLLGAPVLRQRAVEIAHVDAELQAFVDDLFETMHDASGVGLAANQVGVARRVAVVEASEGQQLVLINPVIIFREGTNRAEEGCLSIPEIFGEVERATRVRVETTTLDGRRIVHEAEELEARAIQHEIDHLDGILFIDHLSPLKRRLLLQKWKRQQKVR